MNGWTRAGLCRVRLAACCTTRCRTLLLPPVSFRAPPPPLSCSVAFGVAPLVPASGLPGLWCVCGVVAWGGGGCLTLPPHGQATVLATSKNCGYCVLLDCGCIVRASCSLPAAGARGTKGNGRSQQANSPPNEERTRGSTSSGASQKGGADEKGAAPPPPPADKWRATCSHRARNVHAQEGRATNPPPAASKHDGNTVVMECAYNLRATCLPPEAGTQGMKGTEGSHTANPPPTRARMRGPVASGAAKKGRVNRKGAAPPRGQMPRHVLATCLQRACPGGKDNTSAPLLPPPQEGNEGSEETEKRGRRSGGGTQGRTKGRRGRTLATGEGKRQAEPGPGTDKQTGRAGKGGGRKQGACRTRQEPGRAESSAGRGKPKGRKRGHRGQHSGRRGSGRKAPTGDAGKGPILRSLGASPVTVSAPPDHTQ